MEASWQSGAHSSGLTHAGHGGGSFWLAGNTDLTSTAVDRCDVAAESWVARCGLAIRNRKEAALLPNSPYHPK
jgi:hypothetical protein